MSKGARQYLEVKRSSRSLELLDAGPVLEEEPTRGARPNPRGEESPARSSARASAALLPAGESDTRWRRRLEREEGSRGRRLRRIHLNSLRRKEAAGA
jgi:hypothetical protein